jgi:hypothetical protein
MNPDWQHERRMGWVVWIVILAILVGLIALIRMITDPKRETIGDVLRGDPVASLAARI